MSKGKKFHPMNITLKDVAETAGVSIMTVSRVINQKDDIAKKTKEKVIKAINKLNYRPNKLARYLAIRKSDFITMIVPDISNPFFSEMIKSAENVARKNGYNIILGDAQGDAEIEKEYIHKAIEIRSDGILLASPRLEEKVINEINNIIPIVIIDRHISNDKVLQVYIDNFEGAFTAVEHLINLGHRRIGFLNGPKEVQDCLRREAGYRASLEKYKIPYDPELIIISDFEFKSGYNAFDTFMNMNPRPTAIFTANDIMAFGLIQRAHEKSIKIPENLSVVGFDDISMSEYINPPLTTVRHPRRGMGYEAVTLLIKKMVNENEILNSNKLKNVLILRKSTTKLNNNTSKYRIGRE